MRFSNISVLVKPTNACNLNCPYCFDRSKCEVLNGHTLTKQQRCKLMDMCEQYAEEVHWLWHGGEVTLMGQTFFKEIQEEFFKRYNR